MAGLLNISGLNLFVLILYCPVNYGVQLTINGEDGSQGCFYPRERVLLICSHRPWLSVMLWSYSPVNIPANIESARIPNAHTVAINQTVHTVEITSAEKALDGNSLWCGLDTGNSVEESNTVTFHIAPGGEQNWTLSVSPNEASHVASFLLMQVTFTSHQYCAQRRAMIAINTEAYNVSSNMTLQEHNKLPLVKRVTQTLLNITNLLHCVHYRHHVSVLYPGLGETKQKVYEDTSMLGPGLPYIEFTKLSTGTSVLGIVTVQTTGATCHPHQTTAYTLTLREVTNTANITVIWHTHDNRDNRENSSSISHGGETRTYWGDFGYSQDEMKWLVRLTSVSNSSRDTKLKIRVTFGNTLGVTTSTATFNIALALGDPSETPCQGMQDEAILAIALYITAPLLSILTAASLTIACLLAVKLHRTGRNKNVTSGNKAPIIYDTVATSHSTTRPETEDPPTVATPNPSYVPLEQLLMSHTVHQQDHV